MTPQHKPLVSAALMPPPVTDATALDLPTNLPHDIALQGWANPKQAAAFFGCSLHHWRQLYRSGRVPPPIRLSERVLGWKWSTLIAFSKTGRWEA